MKISSIKTNAILNIVYTISNILFPLITFPYVSRILQVDLLGKVNFFSNVSNYATVIAALGISTYGIRAVARVRDNEEELSKTVIELLIINTVLTIAVVAALLIAAIFVPKFKENYKLLLLNCVYILSVPLSMNWLFSGLEQYSYITKRALVFKTISLICVFLFVREKSDYIIYAIILILSSVSSNICNFIYSKKFIKKGKYILNAKRHISSMLMLFASILAINVYTHLDTIMLGFINGDKEVGLYTTAIYAKAALLTLVNAISAVLLPRISFYAGEGKINEIEKVLNKSVSIIMMISIPLTIFFILEASDTIMVIGGAGYIEAIPCMKIIMPILLISGFSNITGNQILIPLGYDYCFMRAVVTGALVDLVFNIILMPKMGCTGAAISTLMAEIVQMSVQLKYAWKYISHSVNYRSIVKFMTAAVCSAVILIEMENTIVYSPILRMMIFAIMYFFLYGVALLLFKEKELCSLLSAIKRKIKLLAKTGCKGRKSY